MIKNLIKYFSKKSFLKKEEMEVRCPVCYGKITPESKVFIDSKGVRIHDSYLCRINLNKKNGHQKHN
jgi:hypothetical protein